MQRLNDNNDRQLIAAASELLHERNLHPVHSTAAALRLKSGEIITSLNADHFSSFLCAEGGALSRALNEGKREFESIVAVRKNEQGGESVANMCGKCRQIFHDYAPGIRVIVAHDDAVDVRTIEELLPFSFLRQKEKIQAVLNGASE